MSENLIYTSELCKRLSLGADAAKKVMAEHGVYPICFGVGRGRGRRWLASAVDDVILRLHQKAQPVQKKQTTNKPKGIDLSILHVDEIFGLTSGQNVQ